MRTAVDEEAMESRIARLETEVASLRYSAANAADVSALRSENAQLSTRIDQLEAQLEAMRIHKLEAQAETRLSSRLRHATLDGLLRGAAIAITAAIYIGLAHGFGWI